MNNSTKPITEIIMENIGPTVLLSFAYLFFILMVVSLMIFPFYVYVFNINRKRDEKAIIFPITNHFCEMVKISYFLLFFFFLSIYISYLMTVNNSLLFIFFYILVVLSYLVLLVITQVFHLMISVLAIQKFFLYFIPSSEGPITVIQKLLNKTIWIIYLAFGVKEIISFLWYISTGSVSYEYDSDDDIAMVLYEICLFADIVMFLSGTPISTIMIITMTTDIIITPLIIQISYLGCNKRNMDVLIASFGIKKLIRKVFKIGSSSIVEPEQTTQS
ncbi:hypothetical protein CRE_19425 [Caenorhabditis remanei]|uniref:Serpentine Receptor, class Z n=2 Tax=Caenorhabditis remanei TaxID=31234 RepID=E3NA09_CAERE|nr:hypothetical protein CRE_19425 [Caenorhabditis remanei]